VLHSPTCCSSVLLPCFVLARSLESVVEELSLPLAGVAARTLVQPPSMLRNGDHGRGSCFYS
jgi:hypothetical protein